jgi:hypothetical protein
MESKKEVAWAYGCGDEWVVCGRRRPLPRRIVCTGDDLGGGEEDGVEAAVDEIVPPAEDTLSPEQIRRARGVPGPATAEVVQRGAPKSPLLP